ncbi:MAG: hypothetical protein AB7G48_06195 [Nitrospiraceae bacterium]
MEVDRDLEVLDMAEAMRGVLDPLERGVDRFEAGVGNLMLQLGKV